MTIDIIIVDPSEIAVIPSHSGAYPKIKITPDIRILLKSWSQLRDLQEAIKNALDAFEASELKDAGEEVRL